MVGPGGSSRFRQRKLNPKTALPVVREADIEGDVGAVTGGVGGGSLGDAAGDARDAAAALAAMPKFETGVETKEEKEHHLQAIIHASHAGKESAQLFIPTPDAVPSEIRYAELYPACFQQPATYIRFSSTVEDSIGCPYCMTDEDEEVLLRINAKARGRSGLQCSEEQFERIMYSFEETSLARQPFAAVDNTPVLGFEEMAGAFDETVDEGARRFAKEIYDYWKRSRSSNGNVGLVARLKTLKMETGQELDETDPYVCFRRREVRQVRKTRGRDAQVGEKLKKLRKELEDARQLLDLVKRRELARRDDLAVSRDIFEKRAAVRDMKRTLNIEYGEDDELLVTQRTPKKRAAELPPPAIRPAPAIRLTRNESVATPEAEVMVMLRDKLREREQRIQEKMNEHFARFEAAGENFVDRTEDAILGVYTPPGEESSSDGWVCAKVEYTQQPTPPDSVASEDEDHPMTGSGDDEHKQSQVRWADESEFKSFRYAPRCRQRRGRGGLFIDRRFVRDLTKYGTDDRYKYDCESGDELVEEPLDPYSTEGFLLREKLRGRWRVAEIPRNDPAGGARRG